MCQKRLQKDPTDPTGEMKNEANLWLPGVFFSTYLYGCLEVTCGKNTST